MSNHKGESSPNPTSAAGMRRLRTDESIDKVMLGLQERRDQLRMTASPEEAEIRALALDAMPAEAFRALLAVEDDEARERQIRALVNAQRHKHVLRDVYPSGRCSGDDRVMFRWRCTCGVQTTRDYFSAQDARDEFQRHADGRLPKGFERCELCGRAFEDEKGNHYCSADCRLGHAPAPMSGQRYCTLPECQNTFPGRETWENFCCKEHERTYGHRRTIRMYGHMPA